jgi:hypothetical protein
VTRPPGVVKPRGRTPESRGQFVDRMASHGPSNLRSANSSFFGKKWQPLQFERLLRILYRMGRAAFVAKTVTPYRRQITRFPLAYGVPEPYSNRFGEWLELGSAMRVRDRSAASPLTPDSELPILFHVYSFGAELTKITTTRLVTSCRGRARPAPFPGSGGGCINF